MTPQAAIEKAEAREWTIIFPTLSNLELLCAYHKAKDAERVARARKDVATVQPRIVKSEHGIQFLIPGDEGYEEVGEMRN